MKFSVISNSLILDLGGRGFKCLDKLVAKDLSHHFVKDCTFFTLGRLPFMRHWQRIWHCSRYFRAAISLSSRGKVTLKA